MRRGLCRSRDVGRTTTGLEGASLETARRDAMDVNWSFWPNYLVLESRRMVGAARIESQLYQKPTKPMMAPKPPFKKIPRRTLKKLANHRWPRDHHRRSIVASRLIRLHGLDRNAAGQSRGLQFEILGNSSAPQVYKQQAAGGIPYIIIITPSIQPTRLSAADRIPNSPWPQLCVPLCSGRPPWLLDGPLAPRSRPEVSL